MKVSHSEAITRLSRKILDQAGTSWSTEFLEKENNSGWEILEPSCY